MLAGGLPSENTIFFAVFLSEQSQSVINFFNSCKVFTLSNLLDSIYLWFSLFTLSQISNKVAVPSGSLSNLVYLLYNMVKELLHHCMVPIKQPLYSKTLCFNLFKKQHKE